MNPIRSVAVLLAMSIGLLAGCGGNAAPAPTASALSPAPPAGSSTAARPSGGPTGSRAASAPARAPVTSPAPTKLTTIPFQLDWIPPTEYSYFVMAQAKGFYAKEGLQVDLKQGSGSGNTVKVIGAGTVGIGLADANSILAGRAQGVPVTAVMTLFYTSPTLVVTLKGSGITKLGDLIGKKLGETPDSANVLVWRAAMAKAGLDYKKVNTVDLDGSALVPALVGKQVDAILGQTQPADLEAKGVSVGVVSPNLDFVSDSIMVNDSYLSKDPAAVRAFLRASINGVNYVKDHPDETLDVMAKQFPTMDRKQLELRQKLEGTWVWAPLTPKDQFGLQLMDSWNSLQNFMFDTKQMDKKVDLKTLVTNDYLPYK